ncbi:hypothetical protein HXX76_007110 [Chlamydomonas incerta]|uniref:Uncharacterized protein n=1 Tax=Chlamydomonas incerta TaxID=51695 RepID=A0A835TBN0_CHLIN|nr:hypothetical protein HXX76_007110 [Chlamydomonas incerta]|eukprot:KAG2435915.1 hypothetical protein HXX76_007110 [Chlamydomonas incerta]
MSTASDFIFAVKQHRWDDALEMVKSPEVASGSDWQSNGGTALHMAANTGWLAGVRALLAAGADANKANSVIGELLKAGADVNAADENGDTPLMAAAMRTHQEEQNNKKVAAVVAALLAGGADVAEENAKERMRNGDEYHFSPVDKAAQYGLPEVLRLLLHGAPAEHKQALAARALEAAVARGNSASAAVVLELAAAEVANAKLDGVPMLSVVLNRGNVDAARALVAAGADVHATDKSAEEVEAIMRPAVTAAVELLVGAGADVSALSKEFGTPLHTVAANGPSAAAALIEALVAAGADLEARKEPDVVKAFIKAGASLTATDKQGYMPLHIAAQRRNADMVAALLAVGADVDARTAPGPPNMFGEPDTAYGTTPFIVAVAADWDEDFKVPGMLLAAGANVNAVVEGNGKTALIQSAASGRAKNVQWLLEAGATTEGMGKDGMNALHAAANYGSEEAVKALLAAGAKADAELGPGLTPHGGRTCLHLGSTCNSPGIVKALIEAGVSATAADAAGSTPLHSAAYCGNEEVMQLLLAAEGQDVNARAETPLHVAARAGNVTAIRLLLAAGADVNAISVTNETPYDKAWSSSEAREALEVAGGVSAESLQQQAGEGEEGEGEEGEGEGEEEEEEVIPTPLGIAIAEEDEAKALELLAGGGEDVNATGPETGDSLLMRAAALGSPALLRALLGAGADVGVESKLAGITALHLAAAYLPPTSEEEGGEAASADADAGAAVGAEMVALLLEAGAKVEADSQGPYGTPLFAAARAGSLAAVRVLLEAGADKEARAAGASGYTPLHAAISGGHTAVVEALVAAGADVNAYDWEDGYSCLHLAAALGHADIARALLGAGAQLEAKQRKSDKKSTPLIVAATEGHAEAGADMKAVTEDDGNSALMCACFGGPSCDETVAVLLEAGADASAPTQEGYTPLHAAALMNGVDGAMPALLKAGVDVNAAAADGNTPLHVAAEAGWLFAVRMLLDAGADVNAKNQDGNTAMHLAATGSHTAVVEALEARGADANIFNNDDKTPAMIMGEQEY